MNSWLLALERASAFGLGALFVALVAQKCLDGRVPAAWRAWVWRVALLQTALVLSLALLPLAPLALPVLPSLSSARRVTPPLGAMPPVTSLPAFSGAQSFPAATNQEMAPAASRATSEPAASAPSLSRLDDLSDELGLAASQFNSGWLGVLLGGIYVLGLGWQCVALARSGQRVRRVLRAGEELEGDATGARLRCIAARIKVVPLPRLVQVQGGAPFLVGVLRPCIVLPRADAESARSGELDAILSHELAHVKRCDLAWNVLIWGVQTIFWFHPLAWVSRAYLSLEIESACDEMVLQGVRIAPQSYGALLLNTLDAERTPLVAGMADGFALLKTRLLRLDRAPRHPKRAGKIAFTGALALALVSVLPFRLVSRSQAAQVVPITPIATGESLAAKTKKDFITKAGVVAGTVVAPDGQPVAGARVSWIGYSEGGLRVARLATVPTDTQGRYRFEDSASLLNRSLSFVGAQLQWRAPQLLVEAKGWGMAAANIASPDSVDVRVIRLAPATAVKVVFRDGAGKVVPSLPIKMGMVFFQKLTPTNPSANYIMLRDVKAFEATTDANGVCHFEGLPQGGSLRLEIDDARFAQLTYETGNIDLATGVQRPEQTIQLQPGATVRGRITDGATGKGVGGIHVNAQGQNSEGGWGEAVSDANGNYVLAMLEAGSYNLSLNLDAKLNEKWTSPAHEGVEVAVGEQKQGLDFQIISGTLITGRVTDEATGAPIEGAGIGIYGPAHPQSSAQVQVAYSGADGTYQLRVPGGKQMIYMYGPPTGYTGPEREPKSSLTLQGNSLQKNETYTFTVGDGRQETIDWQLPTLKTAPALKVTVLGSQGRPAANALIEVVDGAGFGSIDRIRTFRTDADGHVTLKGVTDKDQIRAHSDDEATAQPLTLPAGSKLTVRLQRGVLASFKGQVVDQFGKPLPNGQVDFSRWFNDHYGDAPQTVKTDAEGKFVIPHLWPGIPYSIVATAPGYGRADLGQTRLKSGEARELEPFSLLKADKVLTGRVVDEANHPVAQADVMIIGRDTAQQRTTTDADGKFRFDSVVAGHNLQLWATSRALQANLTVNAENANVVVTLKKRS